MTFFSRILSLGTIFSRFQRMIFYNVDIEKEVKKKKNTENYYAIFNGIFNKLIIVNGGKVTFFSKILSLETIFCRFQFKDDLLQR